MNRTEITTPDGATFRITAFRDPRLDAGRWTVERLADDGTYRCLMTGDNWPITRWVLDHNGGEAVSDERLYALLPPLGCPTCGGEGYVGGLVVSDDLDVPTVDEICHRCHGRGVVRARRLRAVPDPRPGHDGWVVKNLATDAPVILAEAPDAETAWKIVRAIEAGLRG